MNTELRQKLDAYFAANEDALFADLAGLVAIKSVKGQPEEGAPYGRGSREALDYVLALGERDGFKTESCEGRVGFESYGEGEKYIASIAHVDVVPAGNGWNTDPFTMTEREGFVLGRGVLDDKGEAIISHWALKFLKDNDIPVRYETRVIFGANEEAGMDDMACYKAHYPEPAVAFVPDTSFPCEFAEKGGLRGVIRSGKILENIVSLCGGQAVNQVADRAEAVVRYDGELLPTEAVETEKTEDGLWRLVAHGVAKHACMPQHSVNAIGVLVKYLLANGVPAEKEQTYLKAILPLLTEIHGESFGLNVRDDVFPGSTTIVGCTIRTEDGELVQSFDSRYVTTLSGEKIAEALRKGVGCFEVIVERDVPVSSIDRSNPALRLCTEIYRSYRDDPSEPFASSGGTYARCFGNAFAFGPQYRNPGYPAFVGGLHMANEGVPKEQLILAAKIYAESFIALQELEY